MSYKNLEVWQLSKQAVIEVLHMSLQLPKFELFEEGNQIRRSIKSVKSNIVEEYGRRRYKQEFVKFLIYSLASNMETIDHLETLYETKSLSNKQLCDTLHNRLDLLGKKLYRFLLSVENGHNNFGNH